MGPGTPPLAPHLNLPFQSLSAYCSSLAHKTNHSFLPNGQFVVYDHPKFGLIPCISTIADIEEGEEVGQAAQEKRLSFVSSQILVGYGYDLDESPDWYKVAWEESEYPPGPGPCSSRAGVYGQEGVDYKDWLECTVRKPICGRG